MQHKVTGYTLSYCPWCKKTKKFFQDHGIQFEYVDYDLQDEQEQSRIEEEMRKYSKGGIAFPYVVIDGTVVIGWNPGRYEELLNIKNK
jgi:glutaredoxin